MKFDDIFRALTSCLSEAFQITLVIFVLMVFIELVVLKYKKRLSLLAEKNKFVSYLISALFGIIPGCIGMFAMDSLYMAGFLSFGGLTAVMISSIGDEGLLAFSMLFSGKIEWSVMVSLLGSLFILGIIGGMLADFIAKKMKLKFSNKCTIVHHNEKEFSFLHFVKDHVYKHILKKHIWQIFIWILITVFLIEILSDFFNESTFKDKTSLYLLFAGAIVGILPISGPSIFLLMMFINGLVPFSVILTNSIVQDGHGLLPILGFSFKDALKVKAFNLAFGLIVGLLFYSFGF